MLMPPRKSTEVKAVVTNGVDEDTPTRGQAKAKDGLGVEVRVLHSLTSYADMCGIAFRVSPSQEQ